MARNGSGSYTIPNTYSDGQTETAAVFNQNFADIAAELTNSVAADGQTTMSAPLKAANGSASLPAYTFGSDTNTGAYRSGADEWSVAVGGVQTLKVSSSGIDAAAGKLTEGGNSLIPAGFIGPYAGSSAPGGWLLCDGASYVRTDQPALFSAIGTTYGSADGTHFNVPDVGGRTIAGKEATATRLTSAVSGVDGGTLGAAGGTQSHVLSSTEMPSHAHTGTTSGQSNDHTHVEFVNNLGGGAEMASGTNVGTANGGSATNTSTGGVSADHSHTFTTAAVGGGGAHTSVQPTIILNYIIKT